MKVVRWEIWWQMAWSHHAIIKIKWNKASGRWTVGRKYGEGSSAVCSIKRTAEVVDVWGDLRKMCRREMEGGLECPRTPTPPLMAASTRSRPVSVVGKESVQRWRLVSALVQPGVWGRSPQLFRGRELLLRTPSYRVLVCNLPIWFWTWVFHRTFYCPRFLRPSILLLLLWPLAEAGVLDDVLLLGWLGQLSVSPH